MEWDFIKWLKKIVDRVGIVSESSNDKNFLCTNFTRLLFCAPCWDRQLSRFLRWSVERSIWFPNFRRFELQVCWSFQWQIAIRCSPGRYRDWFSENLSGCIPTKDSESQLPILSYFPRTYRPQATLFHTTGASSAQYKKGYAFVPW